MSVNKKVVHLWKTFSMMCVKLSCSSVCLCFSAAFGGHALFLKKKCICISLFFNSKCLTHGPRQFGRAAGWCITPEQQAILIDHFRSCDHRIPRMTTAFVIGAQHTAEKQPSLTIWSGDLLTSQQRCGCKHTTWGKKGGLESESTGQKETDSVK